MSIKRKLRYWSGCENKYVTTDDMPVCCERTDYLALEAWDDDKWEQSIGLKDINGKEIFENDIDKNTNYFVKYNQLHCCYSLFSESGFQKMIMADICDENGDAPKEWKTSSIEVIGNINQNPELLKK